MRRVGEGDLNARNGETRSHDEIGQVAGHLDDLLDELQDRDAKLRAWADELEQRVEERTAELRDANAKLEDTWQQLVMSEKLASIGEITAGVAHEINNPVAVIQGNLDVMRESLGERADSVAVELDLIDRQVARINSIVGKLLQFARPHEFSGAEEAVHLRPLVHDCLVLVEHVLSKAEIEVETDLAEAPRVRIEAGEMQQVVVNLLVNAAQAMTAAGTIRRQEVEVRSCGLLLVTESAHTCGPFAQPNQIPESRRLKRILSRRKFKWLMLRKDGRESPGSGSMFTGR